MSYRIKTVAAMTGIPRATIVAWERRYNLLDPTRSPAGYRIYSDEDVAFLRSVKRLVDDGLAISEALQSLARAGGLPALPPVSASRPSGTPPEPQPRFDGHGLAPPAQGLLDALLAFDRTGADRTLLRLQAMSYEALIDEVYLPVLRQTGDSWERGEVTVAQEHFVSGFCREMLLNMFHTLGAGPDKGVAVTCAGPPGEQHEIGLLALSVRLALRGFRVTWLGTDLPFEDLCAFLARHPPSLLCLTVMRREAAAEVTAYARQVRACAHPATVIAVGGPGAEGLGPAGTDSLWFVPSMDALLERWTLRSTR